MVATTLLISSLTVPAIPVQRRASLLSRRIEWELNLPRDLDLDRRDVVSPRITSPDASSVWPVGSKQIVTWDTSELPPYDQITNPTGRIVLGWDSGDSLNLQLNSPLAQGFNITLGRMEVTVPNVRPRKDYLIVLMGNSGNTSPSFAITSISGGPESSTSPRPPTSSPSASASPSHSHSSTTKGSETTTTTIAEPVPTSGTAVTTGNVDANTSAPVADTTATVSGGPTPSTTNADQASAESTPLGSGSIRAGPVGCWSLAIGLLVSSLVAI